MAEANESAERKERCATCRWWVSAYEERGHCHCNPPTLIPGKEDSIVPFPKTWKKDFCGQWRAKE